MIHSVDIMKMFCATDHLLGCGIPYRLRGALKNCPGRSANPPGLAIKSDILSQIENIYLTHSGLEFWCFKLCLNLVRTAEITITKGP